MRDRATSLEGATGLLEAPDCSSQTRRQTLRERSVEQPRDEQLVSKILVTTDFSPASIKAVERAVALAGQCNAQLTIFHVIDVTAPALAEDAEGLMKRLWNEGSARMGRLAGSLCGRVDGQTMIEQGLPWETIVEKSQDFDLLILAKRCGKHPHRLFSNQTLERVIENAKCPVMVVRDVD